MNYLLFIVTFFPISLMPGINMTYAMSIGMSLGYVRALPMMAGQLTSLAFVGICCMLGVGAVLAHYSFAFKALNIIAGLYCYILALCCFLARGSLVSRRSRSCRAKSRCF
ncbi:LysE family translocator [Campylobacter showae]